MAAIVTGCLGAVGGKVGELILRQFNYLCFRSNITNLKHEAKNLEVLERDLQGKVQAARDAVRVITDEVENWLKDSNKIKDEIVGILSEVPNVESDYFRLGARFSLSKRARERADRVKELRDQCKFNDNSISLPGPPPATKAVPSESSYEFKSRKQIEEDIMTTLRGEDVKMMGICGMGGLGKTTMAKRIMNRALKEGVFEEIVMAVVSRNVDDSKIQLEIGGSLGLKLEGESSQGRVQKLHERLSGPKRTLVILDDVWKKLELTNDLGIPCDYKGCTILVTSRNRDVLSRMNVQEIFGMEVLSEEDSWLLFRMGAGQCVDDTKLNSIAKDIVSECAGLPIVLTTVGAALKDVHVSIWENALQQLKINCTPDNIPEYIAEVYNPLKVSYDVLERKYQDMFLLCCLYPEDAHIPLEQLTYFCMGLRLLEGAIENVEAARNRIRALSKVLKSRSLLLDSERGDDYVRMHDVVRDVCIFIAKQKGYIGDNDMTSSLQRYKLDSRFELLQIRNSDEEITFDGITDLYVLSIESCSQLTSLPFTQVIRNLNTLVLSWCPRVDTLSVVGELVNLEILICRHCDSIEELPPEIKGLNRLKVLDLTGCENLQRIGRGIVSNLVGLEELKMLQSFDKWEAEDRKQRENAGLKELEALNKLRCLEIEIDDLALAAENIRLSSEVDRFTITFSYQSRRFSKFDEYFSNKKMLLNWEGASCLGDWIKVQLLRDTECLLLVGNGANEVGPTDLEKIRYLELGECESMKKVVTSSMDKGGATVFPSIEHLKLFKLPKLEEICDDRISSNSFQNLKILTLVELPVLKQLWKSSPNNSGNDFLPQLEVLKIHSCRMMEAVFLWKGEDNSCHHTTKRFPKLKELELINLPNLISLCQGIEGIEFPLLRKLDITKCGKMKGMVWNEKISGGSSNNASIHGLFCPQQVSFSELEELRISECQGNLSLFTSSIARNIVNLKELRISYCFEMVEVIKDEEEKGMSGGQSALLFPKLHTLQLWSLPNLLSFCESKGIESIQFPVLKELYLNHLPNLISLCQGIEGIEFPLMRRIKIENCGKMKGMVWNEKISGGSSNNASIQGLFCPQQVLFGCLKKLDTDRNSFSELEELSILKCAGILSLFTSSMARNLVNLKELWISDCDEMVEVIKDDEEKGMSGGRQRPLLFPKLQMIELWSLPKLVSFCELKGIEISIEFPVLRSVKIMHCEKMKGMVANGLTSNDNNSGGSNNNAHPNFFCESQLVSFGCVKELEIDWNPFCSRTIHVSLFNGLEKLTIRKCASSLSLFTSTSSIAGNLLHLKELRIEECHEMVQVIIDDEETGMSGGERASLFPKLHKISLSGLSKLVSFCELKCDVEFPSLRRVEICDCPNMKNFTLGSVAAPNLESFETNLNNYLLQVPFNTPKELSVSKNEKPLNCYQIHGSVFDRLEVLNIDGYYGSMSLFSSSITGNLVNLTTLTIWRCREMVKVIEEKEEEKEKVVSAAQTTTILFPKLH